MSSEPLTAEQIEELKKRHIRSFCMRRGHISNAQEKALEELLPLYEIHWFLKSAAAWEKPLPLSLRLILKSTLSDAKFLLPVSAL